MATKPYQGGIVILRLVKGIEFAAVITEVRDREAGIVDLFVFPRFGVQLPLRPAQIVASVPYWLPTERTEPTGSTWHWPLAPLA